MRCHVCSTCGMDLRRLRALRDPHYRLPIVVCPECETAIVRRRHPIEVRWRRLRALLTSLAVMLIQIALLGTFVTVTTLACREMHFGLVMHQFRGGDPDALLALTLTFVALPTVIGVWLSTGLGHWPGILAWIVFPILVAVALAADTVIGPIARQIGDFMGAPITPLEPSWDRFVTRLSVLLAIMVISPAGVPFGAVGRRFDAALRRHVWRSRRKRMRLRSAAA